MKIYVKYMVSLRCKLLVQHELQQMGFHHAIVDLGIIETFEDVTPEQRLQLGEALQRSGLQLLDSKKSILIERIKNVIVEMIHHSDEMPKINYSEYISQQMGYDYTYLSNLFSEVKGMTIQQFIITHKIEKIKELLLYDELNLTEIASKMHYSSIGHMSNQFKKATGLSPRFYKQLKQKRSGNLEDN